MRPAKVIVCAGSHLDRLSRRRFMLQIWGYRVISANSADEAIAALKLAGDADLLLIDLPLIDFTPKILADAKRSHPGLRTLIVSNHSAYYDPYGADGLLTKGTDSTAELLARIRTLVARKRGPRKKPVLPASQIVSEPARVA